MPLELRPEYYALHIWMTFKGYAHEVIYFSFLVVGAAPQAYQRRQSGIFPGVTPGFYYQAVVVLKGDEQVDNLEVLVVVDCRNRAQIVEVEPVDVLQKSGYVQQRIAINDNSGITGLAYRTG